MKCRSTEPRALSASSMLQNECMCEGGQPRVCWTRAFAKSPSDAAEWFRIDDGWWWLESEATVRHL